jgi:hypothetical protein
LNLDGIDAEETLYKIFIRKYINGYKKNLGVNFHTKFCRWTLKKLDTRKCFHGNICEWVLKEFDTRFS